MKINLSGSVGVITNNNFEEALGRYKQPDIYDSNKHHMIPLFIT
jgi:hypothetical protein